MNRRSYTIKFVDVSGADAGRYAQELRNDLLDASPDVHVSIERDNPLAQDFGATLVLLVGTPAALAIANAIGNYISRHREVSLEFSDGDRSLKVSNLDPTTALRLTELMTKT